MNERTYREFSLEAHERAVASLPPGHQGMARSIYTHATEVLRSLPYHEAKSLERGDGRKLILKTAATNNWWLVLHMSKGILRLEFPDKYGVIDSYGLFEVEEAVRTQASVKRAKWVRDLPMEFSTKDFRDAIAFAEGIYATCIEYYSRTKDSTDEALRKYGKPNGHRDGILLPEIEVFKELLENSDGCEVCSEKKGLGLWFDGLEWKLYCDYHHPNASQWVDQSRQRIPHTVRRIVWHRDGGRCACGSDIQIQFDHILPVNPLGLNISGSNCETNIKLLCASCNGRKGNKLIP